MSTCRLVCAPFSPPLFVDGRAAETPRSRQGRDTAKKSPYGTSASAPMAPVCRPATAPPQQGEAVYAAKCLPCHGEKGRGQTQRSAGRGLGTLPAISSRARPSAAFGPMRRHFRLCASSDAVERARDR